ncbi:ribonuclease P protein subunit p14-like [Rhopilema esculentum]|uniref:ribonuclease P protein subunit p14-like n=1 Tax=Rhopilema esculentum TaxID=499914 RepID=UPI0031CEED96
MKPRRKGSKRKKSGNRIRTLFLKLELEEETNHDITEDIFTYIIQAAIKSLHGQVCAAVPLEIQEFDDQNLEATLLCPEESLVKVWSALTLHGSHDGKRCAFLVKRVSPESEAVGNE